MRFCLFLIFVIFAACSARAPELDASITAQSRTADWPVLVPLGPLIASSDAPALHQGAEAAGRTLEWRAADLRRRAARLRALQLN